MNDEMTIDTETCMCPRCQIMRLQRTVNELRDENDQLRLEVSDLKEHKRHLIAERDSLIQGWKEYQAAIQEAMQP